MTVEIRPVEPMDEAAIAELFCRAFGQPIPAGEWSWKFLRNPFGHSSRLALVDGRPVGHLGGWHSRLWMAGRCVPAVTVTESMTDPAARARGRDAPFLVLGQNYFAALEAQAESTFVWGYPNERARAFGERFVGYRLVRWQTNHLASTATLAALPPPAGKVEAAETVPEHYDRLWTTIRDAPGWRLDKSRATLNWRYHDRPHRYYRMFIWIDGETRALAILGFAGERGKIVELWPEPGSESRLAGFLGAIARNVRENGINTLELWANPLRPLGAALVAGGLFAASAAGVPLEIRPVNGWPAPEAVARELDDMAGDFDMY